MRSLLRGLAACLLTSLALAAVAQRAAVSVEADHDRGAVRAGSGTDSITRIIAHICRWR